MKKSTSQRLKKTTPFRPLYLQLKLNPVPLEECFSQSRGRHEATAAEMLQLKTLFKYAGRRNLHLLGEVKGPREQLLQREDDNLFCSSTRRLHTDAKPKAREKSKTLKQRQLGFGPFLIPLNQLQRIDSNGKGIDQSNQLHLNQRNDIERQLHFQI